MLYKYILFLIFFINYVLAVSQFSNKIITKTITQNITNTVTATPTITNNISLNIEFPTHTSNGSILKISWISLILSTFTLIIFFRC